MAWLELWSQKEKANKKYFRKVKKAWIKFCTLFIFLLSKFAQNIVWFYEKKKFKLKNSICITSAMLAALTLYTTNERIFHAFYLFKLIFFTRKFNVVFHTFNCLLKKVYSAKSKLQMEKLKQEIKWRNKRRHMCHITSHFYCKKECMNDEL